MVELSEKNLYDFFKYINTCAYVPKLPITEAWEARVLFDPRVKKPFNFISCNSNKLVVTIGDSWTWGDDITFNNDDTERLQKTFGRIVATELSADWLNLGQGGSGNFWLAEKTEELGKIIKQLRYDHIYIICTLTEVGRQFNSNFDNDIDYVTWFKNNSDYTKLPNFLNQIVVDKIIKNLGSIQNITLRIGTNFVNHVGLENARSFLLAQPWIDLYCNDRTPECYFVSNFVFDAFNSVLDLVSDKNLYLDWLDTMASSSIERRSVLGNNKFFRNYHPLEEGHKVWARYILDNI